MRRYDTLLRFDATPCYAALDAITPLRCLMPPLTPCVITPRAAYDAIVAMPPCRATLLYLARICCCFAYATRERAAITMLLYGMMPPCC